MLRLGFVLAIALVPKVVAGCSMRSGIYPGFRSREAFMLGSPTADTVYAGAGGVQWKLGDSHNGPTFERPIYGQVLAVDSATGPGARASRRVVLVPWDYGADCAPTPWGNSAIWRRPGTHGLYSAILRDSLQWADGIPTYDVFVPEFQPYNGRAGGVGSLAARDGVPWMSAEEVFAVATHFPIDGDLIGMRSFYVWTRAHEEIARREPLKEGLGYLAYALRRLDLRNVAVPIAGSYRVTASGTGMDSVVFFLTVPSKATDWWDDVPNEKPDTTGGIPQIIGYDVEVKMAVDSLTPATKMFSSYLYAPIRPTSVASGRKTWKGRMESNFVLGAFGKTPLGLAFVSVGPYLPATFIIDDRGPAEFTASERLPDGRVVSIRGTRLPPTER